MERIKIKISATGKVEFGVQGVKGKGCRDLTRAIAEITGAKVLETKTTSEFCELPATDAEREKAGRR